MVALMPPLTVLTPATALIDLQSRGLSALGLAAPALTPLWATADPGASDYDQTKLSLKLKEPNAPFAGIGSWETTPSTLSDVTGKALDGPAFVLRLHPEAARRLGAEIDLRTGSNVLPIPVAASFTGVSVPATLPAPQIFLAREALFEANAEATLTFHDARGLPIDPIAVAHLWNNLLQFRPALESTAFATVALTVTGAVGNMLDLATGDLVHVIDPHGWRYASHRPAGQLHILDGARAEAAPFPTTALFELAAGRSLGRTAAEDAALPIGTMPSLRWGFARSGVLGTAPLSPPPLPGTVTLARRFLRVMAVDLDWHLLGNRTDQKITDLVAGDVEKEDLATPNFLIPKVRDPVPGFNYLSSGADVLGAMAQAAQGFGLPGDELMAIAVAPAIDPAVTAPPSPGQNWPVFPPVVGVAEDISDATDPRIGLKANWRNPADGPTAKQDVVLTVDGTKLPNGAHVRAYPRTFVEIRSIGPQPSFVRGDGGAAIANGGPVSILLVNPFGLAPAEAHPDKKLTVDLVVVARNGRRRIFSAVSVAADTATVSPADPGLAGTALLGGTIGSVLDGLKSRAIAPLPLFGLPRTPADASLPTSLEELVKRLASDEQPRQGPRLPTQARFESAFVTGIMPPGQQTYGWDAIVSGIRFTSEARQSRPDLANAGGPAGPDAFAAGIACQGWLARDIAVHAIKRTQPIFIPTGGLNFRGWIATVMDDKWNDPPLDVAGSVAAVALETVAAFCDTPELAAAPEPQPGATLGGLLGNIASALGLPPPTATLGNEARVIPIVQREIATARSGQRDALWSLQRALAQARELVYIESPGFGRTARGEADPEPHQRDLANLLSSQMTANPRLKLIVCTPREGDFERSRAAWTVTALDNRKKLLEDLIGVDPKRVAAFHPFGFPGRAPAIRTTTIIVDDVYCVCGTSHFRRRGMTFDGALDIASIDRELVNGYSRRVADFRRRLMAEKLALANATVVGNANALWVRLGTPEGAFDAVRDLIGSGGAGRLEPAWAGAMPDGIIPKDDALVDPDGVNGDAFLGLFASMIVED